MRHLRRAQPRRHPQGPSPLARLISRFSSLTPTRLQGSTPPHLSTYEFWQLSFKRRKYIANQLAAWEATSSLTGTGRPVDALISPPAPYVSFKHGEKQDIYYTGIGNLNDWPSTVFPVTRVDPAVDVPTPAYDYHTDFDKLNHERYDPAVFAGMPVALQVAGRKGAFPSLLFLFLSRSSLRLRLA